MENQETCAQLSFLTDGGKFWTYLPSKNLCWVKTSKSGKRTRPGVVSGSKDCGKEGKLIFQFSIEDLCFFSSNFVVFSCQLLEYLSGCPKDENPKVLSSTSWGCPGSQLPNNILQSNVLMSRPIMITIIIVIIMIIIMIIIMVIQIIIIIVIIIIQTITIIVMIIMIMIMMMIIMIMIMSRPLLWQVPRHQYLLLGRGRADRQQVELLVGTEQEGGA